MASFSDIMKGVIYAKGRGNFITPDDFGGRVSSASLRTELVNFNNSRLLIHVARGLYFFPHIGKDGKQIRPTLFDILKYAEEASKGKVYPSKDAALYLIGATDEVVNPMVFYTTGSTKTINLNSGPEMSFKKLPKTLKLPTFTSMKIRSLYMVYAMTQEAKITKKLIVAMNKFCAQMLPDEFEQDIEFLPQWMKDNLVFPKKELVIKTEENQDE